MSREVTETGASCPSCDSLSDFAARFCVECGCPLTFGPYDPDKLRAAFLAASRRFWLREGALDSNELHSVRADLRLVTELEFREMAYPKESA